MPDYQVGRLFFYAIFQYFCTIMKSFLHRCTSLLLAILVVFSTLSFTIEKHYCGDNLIDTSFFANAKTCGMEMAPDSCDTKTVKKSCCKDEIKLVKGQDELKVNTFDDLKFHQQFFLQALDYSYVSLYESLPKKIIPNKDYSPPNLVLDIHVLDEVYLI